MSTLDKILQDNSRTQLILLTDELIVKLHEYCFEELYIKDQHNAVHMYVYWVIRNMRNFWNSYFGEDNITYDFDSDYSTSQNGDVIRGIVRMSSDINIVKEYLTTYVNMWKSDTMKRIDKGVSDNKWPPITRFNPLGK